MEAIKKINWGGGVMVGMAAFMLYIIGMAVYMLNQPLDDFDSHYYEKGLEYDSEYNRQKNVVDDHATPQLNVQGNELLISFAANAKGELKMLRPSNRQLDRSLKFTTDTDKQVALGLTDVPKGHWQLVFSWESAGKQYLYKREVTLP
jgi:hypothetical protein